MDKITIQYIYINLEKRSDRREQIENELRALDVQYNRFEAIADSPGIVGCTKSHLAVLKLAKEQRWKSVLIIEDDFTFLVTREEFEKEMEQLQKREIDYDVCMLAYQLMESEDLNCDFLTRVLSAQTASAYIVREHYYDTLIQCYEEALPRLIQTGEHWNYANDQCWKMLQKRDNWVCTKTRIGKQRPGYSDNSNAYTDYEC